MWIWDTWTAVSGLSGLWVCGGAPTRRTRRPASPACMHGHKVHPRDSAAQIGVSGSGMEPVYKEDLFAEITMLKKVGCMPDWGATLYLALGWSQKGGMGQIQGRSGGRSREDLWGCFKLDQTHAPGSSTLAPVE